MTIQKVKLFFIGKYNTKDEIEAEINNFIEHRVVISIQATNNYIMIYYKEH